MKTLLGNILQCDWSKAVKKNILILYYLPKPTHDTLKPDFPKYLKNTKILSLDVDISFRTKDICKCLDSKFNMIKFDKIYNSLIRTIIVYMIICTVCAKKALALSPSLVKIGSGWYKLNKICLMK